ncbi:MAG: 2TM domain-containing protein [Bacteroidota bacterium]
MNRKLYKAAYDRVLEKKYFFRHLIVFVIGNFVLFFLSLQAWTPAIFYLLTLIWIRVIALHFANAYPEVVADFSFKNEAAEEKAIKREMKLLKKQQKAAAKVAAQKLKLQPVVENPTNYNESDLV